MESEGFQLIIVMVSIQNAFVILSGINSFETDETGKISMYVLKEIKERYTGRRKKMLKSCKL